jgi:ubiquinone/menaquinone biosynthesis C-methylase UbiE
VTGPDSDPTPHFDKQASDFDARAGLPAGVCVQVTDAIVAIADLRHGSRVLDLGAGTGEVGTELVARGVEYVAVDASVEMLAVFRKKVLGFGFHPELLVGDAREKWPIDDASVRLVFGSRSLHWLSPEHIVRESFRVASPVGCAILIGRVERSDQSPRARLRRKMRELVGAAGYSRRSGGANARAVVERLVAAGASHVSVRNVATWTVSITPRSIIEAWRRKHGLGGADPTPCEKNDVLDRTEEWAIEHFGDVDVPIESEECYTLEGAMLAGPRSR